MALGRLSGAGLFRGETMAKHTKKHPGFKAVAARIARSEGVSPGRARAILASATRQASAAARRSNPRLKRVPRKKG